LPRFQEGRANRATVGRSAIDGAAIAVSFSIRRTGEDASAGWNILPEVIAMAALRLQRLQACTLLVRVILDQTRCDGLKERSAGKPKTDGFTHNSRAPSAGREVPRAIVAQGIDALAYDVRSKGRAAVPVIASNHGERIGKPVEGHAAVEG
jgi:hypothetical protein